MPRAYISFGSNIAPRTNVAKAVRLLTERATVTGISTVYRTAPELGRDQPDYYNCVAAVATELPPEELKYGVLRKIEKVLGRRRQKDKYASRTIDLDLIAYGARSVKRRGLALPDPAILERDYLAAGLAELRGGRKPPRTRPGLRPLPGYTAYLRKELKKWNPTSR